MKKLIDEKYYALFYFGLLCIFAIPLSSMFVDMQEKGYINRTTLDDVPLMYKAAWYIIITLCFGAFYGASAITLLDVKKRLQGILILGSSSIVIYTFNYIITLRPDIFLFGLIAGAVVGYPGVNVKEKYKEYPRATFIVSFLAMFTVSISFINYVLGIQSNDNSTERDVNALFWYFILTMLFCYIFRKFAIYSIKDSDVFVIGPKRFGKTVFMSGYYIKAEELDKTIGKPSNNLFEKVGKLRSGEWPDPSVITENYKFTYMHGILFVSEVKVDMTDYTGEFLENNIEEIVSYIETKNGNVDTADLRVPIDIKKFGDSIYNSDKLIFLIDAQAIGVKKIVDSSGIEQQITLRKAIGECYIKITNVLQDKPYYIVITKADMFYDGDYEKFKNIILRKLDTEEPLFRTLKRGAVDIIPVFVQGSETPDISEGELVMIGYDKIPEIVG